MSDSFQHSHEYALLNVCQRLQNRNEGRRAIHFHFSSLRVSNQHERHMRIALSTLEEAVSPFEGQVFIMGSHDMVTILRQASLEDIDSIIARLRTLFKSDPLAMRQAEDSNEGKQLATIYDIAENYDYFAAKVNELYQMNQGRPKQGRQPGDPLSFGGETVAQPMTSEQLSRLEETLRRADLSNVFRRQAICQIKGNTPPRPLFMELYISIADLARAVAPDIQIAANRWLFQHLTETLDRRMLAILTRGDDKTLKSSYSININVSTILGKEFLAFDASLTDEVRRTLVIELQIADIFADYDSFIFARDFMKERGYRVCIDGVDHGILPILNRKYMGVDLIKLIATKYFNEGDDPSTQEEIAYAVQEFGTNRIILCRCDNDSMIRTGQMMGISLFQGHFLDSLIKKLKSIPVPAASPSDEKNPVASDV